MIRQFQRAMLLGLRLADRRRFLRAKRDEAMAGSPLAKHFDAKADEVQQAFDQFTYAMLGTIAFSNRAQRLAALCDRWEIKLKSF